MGPGPFDVLRPAEVPLDVPGDADELPYRRRGQSSLGQAPGDLLGATAGAGADGDFAASDPAPDHPPAPSVDHNVLRGDQPGDTASPSPGLASMTSACRSPVTGPAVNATPANSAATIRCTTTAILTRPWSMPRPAR